MIWEILKNDDCEKATAAISAAITAANCTHRSEKGRDEREGAAAFEGRPPTEEVRGYAATRALVI